MNICIFPGTFNPIHNAHLQMAEYALRKFHFDKIIFIPSYLPPHKELNKNLAEHRINMVKLATKYNKKFEVSDIEYNNRSTEKSYTIYTVKALFDKFKINGKINMIIGSDSFVNLNSWYMPEELKKLVHFIVFPRTGIEVSYRDFKDNGWDFEITDFEMINISSTEIRDSKIKNGTKDVIKEYIENNGLYKN